MGIDLTPEELDEMSPEEILSTVNDAVSSLEQKNNELLDEKKSLQQENREIKSDLKELESTVNELKQEQAEEQEDIEAVKENMREKYESKISEFEEKLEDREEFIEEQVVDNQLTEQLLEAGVAKPFLPAAKSMLKQDVSVTKEDGTFQAVAENGEGRKPLSAHVESFVESERGQHYLEADPNTGGGANGGSGGDGGTSEDNPWTTGNLTEVGQLKKEDPERAQQLKQEAEQQGELHSELENISATG